MEETAPVETFIELEQDVALDLGMYPELPPKIKKIHSKDEFELCYLRHQYLRRVTSEVTATDMAPYIKIVSHQAKKTFYAYRNLFKLVGFECDDVINIAKAHLISFLGLYKLDKVPKKYQEFLLAHTKKYLKEAGPADVDNKDRANLTMFMKQRMEDVVRVCRQKARNIKGMPVEEYYAFYGPKKPPRNAYKLLKDHERYGFRKLDTASFKSIKKRSKRALNLIKNKGNRRKPNHNADKPESFLFAGYWYVAVPLEKRSLELEDLTGAGIDPHDNIHNRNPEELLLDKFNEEEFEHKKAEFKASSPKRQEDRVRHFINKHKGNPMFREEIMLAKKFLSDLRK